VVYKRKPDNNLESLYNVEWYVDLEGIGRGLLEVLVIYLDGLKKVTKIIRVYRDPVEIRTGNFPNTRVERYHCPSPFRVPVGQLHSLVDVPPPQ
jgi:hypothetical protein